ncbi:hypothetical protein [Methanobrevibacter sp.]|uniref:hypothetical protein n=1 Tax=Methanobrevibacter sp. TaxID=66852 RepID=UPI003863012A
MANQVENSTLSKIQRFNYKDLIIFLIPVIIFSFYLYIYNPGILTFDSFNQLHQIATGEYTNWHPFFHTFIEMILLKIYASPVIIGIAQILTFSIIWMFICNYFRKDYVNTNLKSITEDRQFILQVIVTLIISAIPINAIYAITLWKDIFFGYFLLLLCFLIKVLVDEKGDVSLKFIILLSAVMAVVSQIRPNGIYIILPLIIVFAYYLYKNNNSENFFIKMPVLAIIFILLIASLNIVYDVEDTQKDAVFAKTTHMLANYDLHHMLSAEDSAKLHEMINETTIKENYNSFFTDPIRNTANQDVYDSNKATYLGMAVSYSLKNPVHFIKYMLGSSEITWDITRDSYWQGKPYYLYEDGARLENTKDNYFKAFHTSQAASFEDVTCANEGSAQYNLVNSFVYNARTNIVLDTIFNSPALYMYLAFLAMAGIYILTRSKDILLVYLPNLLNILVVFVSIPVQDNRYLYPNLLVFYLLIIILIGILTGRTSQNNNSPTNAAPISEAETNIYDAIEQELERAETPEEMEARIRAKVLRELEEENRK